MRTSNNGTINTMDEDEIFADLPPKLRRQVLKAWSGEPDTEATEQNGEAIPPTTKPVYNVMPVAPLMVGVPLFVIGLLLSMTVLFAPIGIPLMVIACVPYRRNMRKQAARVQ